VPTRNDIPAPSELVDTTLADGRALQCEKLDVIDSELAKKYPPALTRGSGVWSLRQSTGSRFRGDEQETCSRDLFTRPHNDKVT